MGGGRRRWRWHALAVVLAALARSSSNAAAGSAGGTGAPLAVCLARGGGGDKGQGWMQRCLHLPGGLHWGWAVGAGRGGVSAGMTMVLYDVNATVVCGGGL